MSIRISSTSFASVATGIALVFLLAGCATSPGDPAQASGASASGGVVASEATVSNVRRVGFLTDYGRLQPGAGGMLCWRESGIAWRSYDKVMFERIQVYLKPNALQMQPVDPTDLKMLVDYFHSDLVKAISSQARVVNAAGPGVLRVRIALTDLVPTNQIASLAGTAAPYGFVAEIGAGAATGKPVGSTPYLGQTGMQVQVRDGATGKLLGECADTEIGLKYAAELNAGAAGAAEAWINGYVDSFTQWDYAKKAFDKWSAEFAVRFAALRNE